MFEPFDIVAQIKNKLDLIEYEEKTRIILAVESGSRAWGFASPDSDYDARFIYVRRPEDYIKLQPVRDVIEWQLDDVFDVSGWDLQKALRLLHESNPTLHEWCASPIVYKENALADPLRELAARHFNPKKTFHHYLSMAGNNYKIYLTGEEVKLKKYFYALRPVLAARWVLEEATAPPMLFDDLVAAKLPADLKPTVAGLVELKKGTPEIGTGKQITELNNYITTQLAELEAAAGRVENRKSGWDELEDYFRSAVMEE